MKKTELAEASSNKLRELSKIGNTVEIKDSFTGALIRVPANKADLVKRALQDPITGALIRSGKFEIDKYETTLINWSQEFKRIRVRSIQEGFQLNTPSLATIQKYKGELKTLALICLFVEEAYSFFNVNNTLNDIQVQMTATLILEEFYFFTVADLRLCFFNAYKNKYGQLYGRLDGSIVIEWLTKYQEERAQEAQKASQKKSQEKKGEKLSPEVAAKYREIFEAVKEKKGPKRAAPVIYKDFLSFTEAVGEEQTEALSVLIFRLWSLLPVEQKKETDIEVFRQWYENKILFRINKGGSLEDIKELLKEGEL